MRSFGGASSTWLLLCAIFPNLYDVYVPPVVGIQQLLMRQKVVLPPLILGAVSIANADFPRIADELKDG